MGDINIDDYEYIMYVDASGDDGFKFEKDSSLCYAVSCFLVKKEDIEYNINILNNIKKIMNYDINNPNHEVKYTSLRRHPMSSKIHAMLEQLKGELFSFVAFKEFIADDPIVTPGDKFFPSFCHSFSIKSLSYVAEKQPLEDVLIVVDRMKQVEMDKVEMFSKSSLVSIENLKHFDIIFRDSKDKNFVLLQIADLLCGTNRSFFELYKNDAGFKEYWTKCPLCFMANKKKKLIACKKNKYQIDKTKYYNFNCIRNLYYDNNILAHSLTLYPTNIVNHLWFLECKKAKK